MSLHIVPAFVCPGGTYFFHLFTWRSRVLQQNTQRFLGGGRQTKKLVENILPPRFYLHNNHTSSLQTLCYFSFFVFMEGRLKIHCSTGTSGGHILLNCTLLLAWAMYKQRPYYVYTVAQNYHAAPASRWPAFPWHQNSSDLTWATLSWRLSVCHCCWFQPPLCSFLFPSPLSVLFWVRNWSGRNVVAQQHDTGGAPTWAQQNSRRRKGKSEGKGVVYRHDRQWGVRIFWLKRLSVLKRKPNL